jgi:hypothetical protein
MKNSDTIGTRNRDLPACSAVPHIWVILALNLGQDTHYHGTYQVSPTSSTRMRGTYFKLGHDHFLLHHFTFCIHQPQHDPSKITGKLLSSLSVSLPYLDLLPVLVPFCYPVPFIPLPYHHSSPSIVTTIGRWCSHYKKWLLLIGRPSYEATFYDLNKIGNVRINVTLGRVGVTFIAVEKQ